MSNTDTATKLFYTWSDLDNDVEYIRNKLIGKLWIPDYIVGVKRGGLIPAIKLSHSLDKPMIMMSCQTRDDSDNEVKLLEAEKLSINSNILIVDDICDSGITMSKIITEFMSRGHHSVKTCSLFYNTEQNFIVDYPVRSLDRSQNKDWIVFPWEV
jgi:hypoxanthine phosphoribosyltransferase